MTGKKEKRTNERFASNATIIFSYFSTKNWAENRSVTLNCSAGGMCFESQHSLRPGAGLYIRTGQNPANDRATGHWDLLRTSTLAEVRWCGETNREDGNCFRIGVKYF